MKRLIQALLALTLVLLPQVSQAERTTPRTYGSNRYETAIAICDRTFDKAENAILANGTQFVDALPGSTLANALEAPILLTERDVLPPASLIKLQSLGVEKVIILGGNRTVSPAVEKSLEDMGLEVQRISGANRYETSEKIAEAVGDLQVLSQIMVAKTEADAVASSYLRGSSIPLVLTNGKDPSAYLMNSDAEITLIGGQASITEAFSDQVQAQKRIWGANRYETALALAQEKPAPGVLIVNDQNFIDAFTASTLAYRADMNILLSGKDVLNQKTATYLVEEGIGDLELIGGLNALSYDVSIQAQDPKAFLQVDLKDEGSYAYWNHHNAYDTSVILTPEDIFSYNAAIRESQKGQTPSMVDVLDLPETLSGKDVASMIQRLSRRPSETRYNAKGQAYKASFYADLEDNLNLDNLPDTLTARFAVTTDRTVVRTFPTWAISKPRPNSGLDYFQETAVHIWEPVCLLHHSKDGAWVFVQTNNYLGWMPVEDVAYADRDTLAAYVQSDSFAVITSAQTVLGDKKLDMGARLPMAAGAQDGDKIFQVLLPQVQEGQLEPLAYALDVQHASIGHLPYTRSNIIRQALKLNGAVYGWGGMNNSRDCSAVIQDLYRTFGILLPRNTGQQVFTPGQRMDFSRVSDKLALVKKLKPGTALYMPGHVMLYLGQDAGGTPKIIHAFGGYYQNGKYQSVNQTRITSTLIKNGEGSTYLSKVTTAITFE